MQDRTVLLPPPPFPVRFEAGEAADSRPSPSTATSTASLANHDPSHVPEAVPWPADGLAHRHATGTAAPKWGSAVVKTEQELYIQRLGKKQTQTLFVQLHKLESGGLSTSSTGSDSGYYGSKSSVEQRLDGMSSRMLGVNDIPEEENLATFDDGEDLVGRPLLHPGPGSDEDAEPVSQGQIQLIPATPMKHGLHQQDPISDEQDDRKGNESDAGQIGVGLPVNAVATQNRRISFHQHVRISGGIRPASDRHKQRHLLQHHQWPSTQFNSAFLGAETLSVVPRNPSVTSLSRAHSSRTSSPSRSASRERSSRRPSLTSGSLFPARDGTTASMYSSSPGSYLPTRSSSPCSSIYAPLQPSKAHCPTPMLIQPPSKRRSTMSLADLMLGRGGEEGENYRALVEEQRRKRAARDHQRRRKWKARLLFRDEEDELGDDENGEVDSADDDDDDEFTLAALRRKRRRAATSDRMSFWTRVGELLALGASGPGPRPSFASYGATSNSTLSHSVRRAQSKRARQTSPLGAQNEMMTDDDGDSSDSIAKQKRSARTRDKTDVHVMFGQAPRRWPVKKALTFTVAVVGQSGTGRTTFVNTLCESNVLPHKEIPSPEFAHQEDGIKIKPVTVELEEDGVRVSLTIVDTPGFGDQIDNEFTFGEILGYLERQYDDILAEESRIKRNPRFRDNRVHALLYFITPTGHALRELDIELMRRLSPRVNVIPVIGKSDTLTPSELRDFKRRVMEDIEHYGIPIYNFPYDVEEDDEETIQDNSELRAMMPFSIVGSEEEVEVNGELVRARRYPWGIVQVDNPQHSDFGRLRNALLNTHLTDLKEITHDFLYENYRTEKLSKSVQGGLEGYTPESSILPEDLATQSVRLKEEQLRREEEKLREIELRSQREISEKRQALLAKEESLRNLESRLAAQQIQDSHSTISTPPPHQNGA
ncbi:Cell division control protein 11 [Microbotryomycetes sp. JL201]|nr:Cell division control protein 11 [Microbotryomycetes sp. JL201]